MQMLTKFAGRQSQAYCSVIKHCYRRNKPAAGQSSAPRWTFSFISA